MRLRIFVYLLTWKLTTAKVSFRFYKQCSQGTTRLNCEPAIFAQNARGLLALDISQNIEKDLLEKLCKILEMEIKRYGPKFVFEKINFRVLHCIQHDFIRQCPGLSKDQTSMSKSPVIQ